VFLLSVDAFGFARELNMNRIHRLSWSAVARAWAAVADSVLRTRSKLPLEIQ
jgi:hypothetical protein